MSYIFMMPQRCHSGSRSKVAVTWRARVSPVTLDLTPATQQKQWSHAADQVTRVKLSELVGNTSGTIVQTENIAKEALPCHITLNAPPISISNLNITMI